MVRRGRPFRQFSRQPVLCRRRHRARHRRRARPQQRPRPCARRCATAGLGGPPARHRRTRPAYRISGSPYRTGPDAGKRRPRIGVVTSIVGIWQYRITFIGEQNHAGTTRMKRRRDAGLALARFCVAIDERFPAAWRTAHGMDHRPHHARSRRAQHHSGPRRNAVSDSRRRPRRHRASGRICCANMATRSTAQGGCRVEVERIRTGARA